MKKLFTIFSIVALGAGLSAAGCKSDDGDGDGTGGDGGGEATGGTDGTGGKGTGGDVNVLVDQRGKPREEWSELTSAIFAALRPYPEAARAVAAALSGSASNVKPACAQPRGSVNVDIVINDNSSVETSSTRDSMANATVSWDG